MEIRPIILGLCVLWASVAGAPSNDGIGDAESFKNLTETIIRYDGAQLWRVDYGNEISKEVVSDLLRQFDDVAIWGSHGSTTDLFVKKQAVDGGAASVLESANITYSVIIDDMQKAIDAENPGPSEIIELQDRKGHRLTWSAYHRIADINSYLEYLAATYPELCKLQTIGYSVEKRPLKVLRVSNGNPRNKAIWVDGGIHAREWISPASVTYILNNLVENWEDQPSYIRDINWYFQPVVNPDGYEFSHTNDRLWRKNRGKNGFIRCVGVDLNRNYGYQFGGVGTSNSRCSEIYRGPSAFSEPETLAQKQFFDNTKESFHAFLTFHSYGQYILYPWGYNTAVPPDHKDLERVGTIGSNRMRKIAEQNYKVGSSGSLLYPAAGASDDYAKSIGIKYSYTIELRDEGRYGFVLPASHIQSTAREAEVFVFTVAQAVAELKRN